VQANHLEGATGVRPGEILAGKYRVEKVLGAGGMGIVVAARHLQLETRVALKFLHPSTVQNEEAVARFAREARASVKITGEHVARVLDVGTLASGAPYMVMEFLEGTDLAAWLEQRGPLSVEQAVDFVLQACVAVAEAHSLGIVHRDLKPANLFCVRRADGQLWIKVLDFGISKMTLATSSYRSSRAATQTNAIMGSPLYMSPEQMTSARDVDARTDIWALGIILHELVSGSAPFQGDTLPEICIKIATSSPEPLRRVRPDAPAGFEAVILRCLQKDREARYRDVGELARDLCAFGPARCHALVDAIGGILETGGPAASSQAAVAGPRPVLLSGTLTAAGSIPPVGRTDVRVKSRTGWSLVGSGAALGTAAAALLGFVLLRSHAIAPSTALAPAPASATRQQPHPARLADSPQALAPALAPPPDGTAGGTLGVPGRGVEDDVPPARAALPPAPPAAPPQQTPHAPAHRHAAAASASASAATGAAQPSPAAGTHTSPANCEPPFFYDEQGNRVFKPECVN
jgi:serine/threonine-protein kinase